ncbi:DinB family protein [Larkinella sp. VNQ87]|uniref:DinB family protein n=1 Tax=Larkinella sp. VNQ87 TaxID=3400921 RepID=UPI003C05A96D
MPTFDTNVLLEQLAAETRELIQVVQGEFNSLTDRELNRQPSPDRWSVAQCLEHLNSYGTYYLPRLENAIQEGAQKGSRPAARFRSGWLGNYFTNSMRPNDDGSIGMKSKAVKNHTPASDLDARAVLWVFLDQQNQIIALLEEAKRVDIQELRVPISIARFVRLSVGDTFRFLLAHEQRHVLQARKVARILFPDSKLFVEL